MYYANTTVCGTALGWRISLIDLWLDLLIKGKSGHRLSQIHHYTVHQEVIKTTDWSNHL